MSSVQPNIPRYLETWSDEIISRANRVRLLIGDAHWLSDGHHKEGLVREFLVRHLPSNLLCSRGFVRPPDQSIVCSPEVDVLISDPVRHAPFFNEGGLAIVAPSSCVAHIEVKTTFEKDTLNDAISSQVATQRCISRYIGSPTKIWNGILFLAVPPSRTIESAGKTIADVITELVKSDDETIELAHLPKYITVFDKFVFLIGETATTNQCRIRGFALNNLSIAVFFGNLFSHLRVEAGGRPSQAEIDTVLQSLNPAAVPWSIEVTLVR